MKQKEISFIAIWNGTATLEKILAILTKENLLLAYDSSIIFLYIYPNELKSYVHTKAFTQLFIAALFIIVKLGCNQDVTFILGE